MINKNQVSRISEFVVGLLFGVGLMASGMTDPGKVIGFLDLFGAWDPSLALVMGGAVVVGFLLSHSPRNVPRHSWVGCCVFRRRRKWISPW